MNPFGIVQGRLLRSPPGELQWFPGEDWPKEFHIAKNLGISFIELIAEREYNPNNPLWSEEGRKEIKRVSEETGRNLYSTCTDFIINHGILGPDSVNVIKHLTEFIMASRDLGCSTVVLPFLEESNLTASSMKNFLGPIKEIAQIAKENRIQIVLETLLNGLELRDLLEEIDQSHVGCVFDTGNRVVDNLNLGDEISFLGSWIKHVHIKDKVKQGRNVLLGTGLVNFYDVFKSLNEINYSGPLVFETTRGTDPEKTAIFHMEICKFFSREAKE